MNVIHRELLQLIADTEKASEEVHIDELLQGLLSYLHVALRQHDEHQAEVSSEGEHRLGDAVIRLRLPSLYFSTR